MNYTKFSLPAHVTFEDIRSAIEQLHLDEYTKGDIHVVFTPIDIKEYAVQFFFNNEACYIPGEIAHHTFYISSDPDGDGLQVAMAEIIGGNISKVNDSIKYFMYITFEYLAHHFNVTTIQSDGLGKYSHEQWLLNRLQPDMSMNEFMQHMDAQRTGLSRITQRIKHFLMDKDNRWIDSPNPFV